MLRISHLVAAIAAASLFTAPVQAQELTGTLKKIKDTGVIKVGHRDASVPFSYLDDQQKPIGYGVDICMKIVRMGEYIDRNVVPHESNLTDCKKLLCLRLGDDKHLSKGINDSSDRFLGGNDEDVNVDIGRRSRVVDVIRERDCTAESEAQTGSVQRVGYGKHSTTNLRVHNRTTG